MPDGFIDIGFIAVPDGQLRGTDFYFSGGKGSNLLHIDHEGAVDA